MKYIKWGLLCAALLVALCACHKQQQEPIVSEPMSDIGEESQTTTVTTTTTTTGVMVVTDPDGAPMTEEGGAPLTTYVSSLPTSIRPVTNPSGSTATKEDGTVKTEIVVTPHITVSTDAQGTTHTSYVTEHTITTTKPTTTTTGALVVTDPQGTIVTNEGGTPVTTHVTSLPTTIRPVTNPSGSTVTEDDGTVKTEIVVPPHITVSTDVQGTTHTSFIPEQTITTTESTTVPSTQPTSESSTSEPPTLPPTEPSTIPTSAPTTEPTSAPSTAPSTDSTTSKTELTTSTTKPTQQDNTEAVSLPAKGYSPDNRIKLGDVTLSGNTVTMVIHNNSAVWETEDGKSYFEYTCFDKNNYRLTVGKIDFGFIRAKSSKVCTFDIPAGTAKVELTDFKAEYWSIPI